MGRDLLQLKQSPAGTSSCVRPKQTPNMLEEVAVICRKESPIKSKHLYLLNQSQANPSTPTQPITGRHVFLDVTSRAPKAASSLVEAIAFVAYVISTLGSVCYGHYKDLYEAPGPATPLPHMYIQREWLTLCAVNISMKIVLRRGDLHSSYQLRPILALPPANARDESSSCLRSFRALFGCLQHANATSTSCYGLFTGTGIPRQDPSWCEYYNLPAFLTPTNTKGLLLFLFLSLLPHIWPTGRLEKET